MSSHGYSRETFYRYKDAVNDGGVEALLEKSRRKPNLENRVDSAVEKRVIDYAIIYETLDELQKDLDDWVDYYNNHRTHQGKMCCGRTPMQTLLDGKKIWQEKVDSLNLA